MQHSWVYILSKYCTLKSSIVALGNGPLSEGAFSCLGGACQCSTRTEWCLRNFGQRDGHREVERAFGVVSNQWLLRGPCTKVVWPRAQRWLGHLSHREVGRALGVVSSHWLPRGAMQQSRPAARTTPVGVGRVLSHWEVGGAFGVVSISGSHAGCSNSSQTSHTPHTSSTRVDTKHSPG